jgi:hypothetical protein
MHVFLNKFQIGGFIHNYRRGKIGMILANSTTSKMCIKWLSGKTQDVSLKPIDEREAKILRRIEAMKALQIGDFKLSVGLPSRILNVKKSREFVDFKVESISVPEHSLDNSKLLVELLKVVDIPSMLEADINSRKVGDTVKTLVRCWL